MNVYLLLFVIINMSNTTDTFESIYKKKLWGEDKNGKGHSGHGSIPENTEEIKGMIEYFIDILKIKTILDIGCGDWQYMSRVNLNGIKYIGIDASKSVIAENNKLYSTNNIKFLHGNICDMDISFTDLIIVKDVLMHLSNSDINTILEKIYNKCKYAIIVDDYDTISINADIKTGEHRPINILANPFNFKGSLLTSYKVDNKEIKNIYVYPPITIPKIIHFMWYSKDENNTIYPDWKYKKYVDSFKEYNPDYTINIWTNKEIHENLYTEIEYYKDFFNKLIHIEKCDFLRYLVMYKYGGLYADLNTICYKNISVLFIGRTLGFSNEPKEHIKMTGQHPLVTNSFLISTRNNDFWLKFIDFIIDRAWPTVDDRYVMINTGPCMLGRFIERFYKDDNIMISNCATQPFINDKNYSLTENCTGNEKIIAKKWKDTSGWGNKVTEKKYSKKKVKIYIILVIVFVFLTVLGTIMFFIYKNRISI